MVLIALNESENLGGLLHSDSTKVDLIFIQHYLARHIAELVTARCYSSDGLDAWQGSGAWE